MNKLKKFASLLLALVMALALAAPAFASDADAPETTPEPSTTDTKNMTTIRAPQNNHTYEVYQIFSGDLNEDGLVLSNVKWGTNGTGEAGEPVDAEILERLQELGESGKSFEEIAEAVSKYVDFDNKEKETQKITNLEEITVHTGYYLLKDLGVKQEDGSYKTPDNETLSLYLVEVVGPTLFAPKAGTVEVDKNIIEDDERVDTNEAAIGDVIDYEVMGKLPENYDQFDGFYYEFSDTLSKGLTFVNGEDTLLPDGVDNMGLISKSVVVTAVNGDTTTNITDEFTVTTKKNDDGTTSISIKCPDLKKVDGVTADSVIVVNYSAVLNTDAEIGATGNPNTVKLIYSNDPNNSGKGVDDNGDPLDPTGETPESKVITYTTELTITKTDENGEVLTGAEFQLTSENGGANIVLQSKETFTEAADGEYWKLKDGSYTTTDPNSTIDGKEIDKTKYESTTTKYTKTTEYVQVGGQGGIDVKAFVNADGTLTFRGLGAGHYVLTETTTPDGYNTIAPIEFDITFRLDELDTPIFGAENVTEGYEISVGGVAGTLATTIVNNSGATLPSTGGIGTTIFYIVGGVLAAGAVILLITKRRMNIEK